MNDPGLPSPYSEPPHAAVGSPVLSGPRQAFYDVLSHRDKRLADMYLGVFWVLAQESNPDRVFQAAHSMRELIEKLPGYLELPVPKNPTKLGDHVASLHTKWRRVQQHPEGVASTNNGRLWNFLKELQLFFDVVEQGRPRRREVSIILINELDPAGLPVPKVVQQARADVWLNLRDYFIKIAHHGSSPSVAELAEHIDAVERFLLDYLRPRTLDNQTEILALIREGEGHGHS